MHGVSLDTFVAFVCDELRAHGPLFNQNWQAPKEALRMDAQTGAQIAVLVENNTSVMIKETPVRSEPMANKPPQ